MPESDLHWMQRALALARESVGFASPNPSVGCVLVKNGVMVGEGFHRYAEHDHAEIVALTMAGENARGATAYVTLEPCSHTGRTGPCADALIHAGVARVVATTSDPNPEVNGQGFERLRSAGIPVETGLMQDESRELNDAFAYYIQTRRPFVTLKSGVSLDGRIAPAPESRAPRRAVMLTGPESQAEVQRLRHASDAILTGIGTVLADDPLLTDRSGLERRRPLLRVVLDSKLRLPLDSRLAQTANDDLVVLTTTAADPERRRALENLGIRVEQLEADPETSRVSLSSMFKQLGAMKMTSVLLEAGAILNAAVFFSGAVGKLSLFYAPVFLGANAVPLFASDIPAPVRPLRTRIRCFGPDYQIQTWLEDPWNPRHSAAEK